MKPENSIFRKRWFYYSVGLLAGTLLSLGIYAWNGENWNFFGIPAAILLTWWAERKGLVLSREESERPTTLFTGPGRRDRP